MVAELLWSHPTEAKVVALHVARKVTGHAIVTRPEIGAGVALEAALFVVKLAISPEIAGMEEAAEEEAEVAAATARDIIRTAVLVDTAGRVLGPREGDTVGPGLVRGPVRQGRGIAGPGLVQKRDPVPDLVPLDRRLSRGLLPPDTLVVVLAARRKTTTAHPPEKNVAPLVKGVVLPRINLLLPILKKIKAGSQHQRARKTITRMIRLFQLTH